MIESAAKERDTDIEIKDKLGVKRKPYANSDFLGACITKIMD